MKQLLISSLLFIVACSPSDTPETVPEASERPILAEDTALVELADTSIQIVQEITDPVNEKLKALLENPMDLHAYKTKWGNSNSSGTNDRGFLLEPGTEGCFYKYMLFHKLRSELPSHPTESQLFSDFVITVYKYDKNNTRFNDANEELILLECALDNPTLGELNWYGKTRIGIMDVYGAPQYEKDDCMIYQYGDRVMSAHLNNNKVDWFKFARIKKDLDLHVSIPGPLLSF